jgi:hypothetical protein
MRCKALSTALVVRADLFRNLLVLVVLKSRQQDGCL